MEVPEKRSDGYCAVCRQRKAVTRDKIFCRRCLTIFIAAENPIPPEEIRPPEARQAKDGITGWQANAIRILEGD